MSKKEAYYCTSNIKEQPSKITSQLPPSSYQASKKAASPTCQVTSTIGQCCPVVCRLHRSAGKSGGLVAEACGGIAYVSSWLGAIWSQGDRWGAAPRSGGSPDGDSEFLSPRIRVKMAALDHDMAAICASICWISLTILLLY